MRNKHFDILNLGFGLIPVSTIYILSYYKFKVGFMHGRRNASPRQHKRVSLSLSPC